MRVPLLSMIGGRLIEAFSPGLETVFFECQVSSRSASFVCKKALHAPGVFDSKNLHICFSTPGLSASNFVNVP